MLDSHFVMHIIKDNSKRHKLANAQATAMNMLMQEMPPGPEPSAGKVIASAVELAFSFHGKI